MILIYSDKMTPRLRYITKLIFEVILKIPASLTDNIEEFKKSEGPKINYSGHRLSGELYLKPHPLLFTKGIFAQKTDPVLYNGETCFFASSLDSFLPFDPLAASFFVVTRMEEYIEPGGGKYGCFSPEKSILSNFGLLKKPVVNIWAQILAGKIKERYPDIDIPAPRFSFVSTIDIDNAWAFKNKGFLRDCGAFLRDQITFNWKTNYSRVKTWLNLQPDPFDNYDFLDNVFEGNENKVVFFFLLGDYNKYDKNIDFRNKNLRRRIQNLSEKYDIGIHPSFNSSMEGNQKMLAVEKHRLESIAGKEVLKSRQHFLRLFFPKTYRNLIEHGIAEDFSMGYSAQTGFRAGICTPFNFFDLEADLETNLMIYPFQIMDVTLRDYLDMNQEQAQAEIFQLMEEVKKVGGTFISVWHNETLSDEGPWKGFSDVFKKMNETGFRWANE